MFGLAIGVHLLNLLTLPFVALIIYFKKFKFDIKTFLITILTTLLIFGIIYIGIIKGMPDITSKTKNLLFIIFLPIIVIINIVVLQIKNIGKNIVNSITMISVLMLSVLFFNSLLIDGVEDISYNKLPVNMDSI